MAGQPIKFGTDGWRGVIADDFTFGNVRRVAQGSAQYMIQREYYKPTVAAGFRWSPLHEK